MVEVVRAHPPSRVPELQRHLDVMDSCLRDAARTRPYPFLEAAAFWSLSFLLTWTVSQSGSGLPAACSMTYCRMSFRTTWEGVKSCAAQISSKILFFRGSIRMVSLAVLLSVVGFERGMLIQL